MILSLFSGSRFLPASSIHIQVLQWMKRRRNWCDAGWDILKRQSSTMRQSSALSMHGGGRPDLEDTLLDIKTSELVAFKEWQPLKFALVPSSLNRHPLCDHKPTMRVLQATRLATIYRSFLIEGAIASTESKKLADVRLQLVYPPFEYTWIF